MKADRYAIRHTFSVRLRLAAVKKDLCGCNKLAKASGLSEGQCANLLNGFCTPRADTLVTLCDTLDVSADYLLGRTRRMESYTEKKEDESKDG